MFKKWWVILIQGILLFILGIFIFNNPVELLSGLSLWFGVIILLTGIVGMFGWMFSGKGERETGSFLWSLVTTILGILILLNLSWAMKLITILFGLWVLLTGLNLLISGWSIRSQNGFGWLLVIVGVLSVAAGLMMILNIGSGALGVATILGVQVVNRRCTNAAGIC